MVNINYKSSKLYLNEIFKKNKLKNIFLTINCSIYILFLKSIFLYSLNTYAI